MDFSIKGTTTLAKAYETYKAKGCLSTDEIALYYGYSRDIATGAHIDHWEQVPFDRLPDELKRLRVSGNKFERTLGCKFAFVENGQLCVGCDCNPLRR